MRRLVVFLSASVLALGMAVQASAQTGVATLSGELLATHETCTGVICVPASPSPTTAFKVRCNPDGSGILSYTVAGLAGGPYPGTFGETGTAKFGRLGDSELRSIDSFQATFHIDSPAAEVDGRKFLSFPTSVGRCGRTAFVGEGFLSFVNLTVRYEAIISPVTGGHFADEGYAHVYGQTQTIGSPLGQELQSSSGHFFEYFAASDLVEARPLLATAKEQCKDEGFLIFGVFENQGDCVSFVETNGKNEPGQNSPSTP